MINTLTDVNLKQIKPSYKIKLIAVCGKAGSGKTYLSRKWAKERDYHEVISSTTRPPREGEVNGEDYWFLSPQEFNASPFLETAEFRGWRYGTQWTDLDPQKINIGVFNPSGIYQLWDLRDELDIIIVFVYASDKIRLIRQLNREEEPDVKEIVRRFETDEKDFDIFYEWIDENVDLKQQFICYLND